MKAMFIPIFDVAIIGGGIIGTASARELILRFPELKVCVLEKEKQLAAHQSGHNSGVIHAGIYYKPGSLKAKLCVEGMKLAYKYCDQEGIQYKKCGKLIVATCSNEISRLIALYERALENNVPDVKLIEKDEITDYETYCKGVKGLWSPHTGIVDWELVTNCYGKNFKENGGKIFLNFEVKSFEKALTEKTFGLQHTEEYPIKILSNADKEIRCRYVLVCGGLHSDVLAKMSGCSPEPSIVPFRGEYLLLKPEKRHLVRGNIYPVPDPNLPFLGVHFTPRMNGDVWIGPNAVPAFKREGYSWGDLNLQDTKFFLQNPGLRKLAFKHLLFGLKEILGSVFTPLQVKKLNRYIPELKSCDVVRGPTGVRAQALSNDGELVDDFVFEKGVGEIGSRILHCRNAPSPAATSSLAIARLVVDKLIKSFPLK